MNDTNKKIFTPLNQNCIRIFVKNSYFRRSMTRIINEALIDLFIISGILLLGLFILEDLDFGFVTYWFNLRILLFIVIFSGLGALATSKEAEKVV